jgi:hypothetical protein
LFKTVWSQTKPLFNAKPEAWSVDKIVSMGWWPKTDDRW